MEARIEFSRIHFHCFCELKFTARESRLAMSLQSPCLPWVGLIDRIAQVSSIRPQFDTLIGCLCAGSYGSENTSKNSVKTGLCELNRLMPIMIDGRFMPENEVNFLGCDSTLPLVDIRNGTAQLNLFLFIDALPKFNRKCPTNFQHLVAHPRATRVEMGCRCWSCWSS